MDAPEKTTLEALVKTSKKASTKINHLPGHMITPRP
jgi:hypothetical protein